MGIDIYFPVAASVFSELFVGVSETEPQTQREAYSYYWVEKYIWRWIANPMFLTAWFWLSNNFRIVATARYENSVLRAGLFFFLLSLVSF